MSAPWEDFAAVTSSPPWEDFAGAAKPTPMSPKKRAAIIADVQAKQASTPGAGQQALWNALASLQGPVEMLAPQTWAAPLLNAPTQAAYALHGTPLSQEQLPFQPNQPIISVIPNPTYMQDTNVPAFFRGAVQGGAEMASGMTTPENVVTLPFAGGDVGAVANPVGKLYAAMMAHGAGEQAIQTLEALQRTDLSKEEKEKQAGALVVNLLTAGGAVKGALHEQPVAKTGVKAEDVAGPTATDIADISEGKERVPPSRQLVDKPSFYVEPSEVERPGDTRRRLPTPMELRGVEPETAAADTIDAALRKQGSSPEQINDLREVKKPVILGSQVRQVAPSLVLREEFEKKAQQRWASPVSEYGPKRALSETQSLKLKALDKYLDEAQPEEIQRLYQSVKSVEPKYPYDQLFLKKLRTRLGVTFIGDVPMLGEGQKQLTYPKEVTPSEKTQGQEESVLTPAISVAGKIFTGDNHLDAYAKAKSGGQPDTSGAVEGFVNKQGKFIGREEAAKVTGLKTNVEPGKLHSEDLPKGGGESGLSPEDREKSRKANSPEAWKGKGFQGLPNIPQKKRFVINNEKYPLLSVIYSGGLTADDANRIINKGEVTEADANMLQIKTGIRGKKGETFKQLQQEVNQWQGEKQKPFTNLPAPTVKSEAATAGGEFALEGPAVLRDAKTFGFGNEQRPAPEQVLGRMTNLGLKGKFAPAELAWYKEQGLEDFLKTRPTIGQVADWMESNGPRVVETRVGRGSDIPEQKELRKLEHEWYDNLSRAQKNDFHNFNSVLTNHLETLSSWKSEDVNKAIRYKELLLKEHEFPKSKLSNWSNVSPKTEKQMGDSYVELSLQVPEHQEPYGDGTDEHGNIVKGRGTYSDTKFPSTHSFPPNTIGWVRGHMQTDAQGRKVFVIHELQSDWARRLKDFGDFEVHQRPDGRWGIRLTGSNPVDLSISKATREEAESKIPMLKEDRKKRGIVPESSPLLPHHESLLLKAAIQHAIREGADAIGVDDAQTAMMTEGHDRNNLVTQRFSDSPIMSKEEAIQKAKDMTDGNVVAVSNAYKDYSGKWIIDLLRDNPSQQKGMTAAYDERLPNILKKLTGQEGERVGFGEHKMAYDNPRSFDVDQLREMGQRFPRKDLIFRNPDGTPKTDQTSRVYSLDKLKTKTESGERFSILGKPTEKATPFKQSWQAAEAMGLKTGTQSVDGLSVAQRIAAQPEFFGKDVSALAQFLVDHFEHVLRPAKVFSGSNPLLEGTRQHGAIYMPEKHAVYADVMRADPGMAHYNVIHELAHAATAWQMEFPKTAKQRAAVTELGKLREKALDSLPNGVRKFFDEEFAKAVAPETMEKGAYDSDALWEKARDYGIDLDEWMPRLYSLINPHEFVAGVFEHSTVRNWLGSIPVEKATLWQRVVDKVKDLLGIEKDSFVDQVFDHVAALSSDKDWVKDEGEVEPKWSRPVEEARDKMERQYTALKDWWKRRDVKGDTIPSLMNSANNQAFVVARQLRNDVEDRLRTAVGEERLSDMAKEALSFAVEAQGDERSLDKMIEQLKGTKYEDTVRFAKMHFEALKPVAEFVEKMNRYVVNDENKGGVATNFRQGYIPHVHDFRDVNAMLFERGGGSGGGSGFTKMRTYDTLADAIKAGQKPVTVDALKLIENRIAAGQVRKNIAKVVDYLKEVKDPGTDTPVILPLEPVRHPVTGKLEFHEPQGYTKMFIGNHTVAVHNGYAGLFQNLMGDSIFNRYAIGRGVMNAVGTAKHSVLGFDVFHAIRLGIKSAPLRASASSPLGFLKSTEPGILALDYNTSTLERMAERGEIPKDLLPEIQRRKAIAKIGLQTGYNIGKISEGLYSDIVEKLNVPKSLIGGREFGLGAWNHWLFDRYQRGLMMETYVMEFDRTKEMYPEKSEAEVGRMVSKKLNTLFGNLQHESWIKSKSMQDLSRLIFLAPQWNEGLLRSEMGALKEIAGTAGEAVKNRRFVAGPLMRDMGMITLAAFIGNQLINYWSRGKPTWENDDKQPGAKISAWIPDTKALGGKGKSEGFFFNPFALSAEVTHTMINDIEREHGDVFDAANDYLEGKMAPSGRALWTMTTGRDWRGNHLESWERVKTSMKEAAPVPIQAVPIRTALGGEESYPGAGEKSLLGSLGMRVDAKRSSEQERLSGILGKPYETASLGERKAAVKANKEREKAPLSPDAAQAAERRAGEHEAALLKEISNRLSPDTQKILKDAGLRLRSYQESLGGKERVPLTDNEKKREQELIVAEYDKRIQALKQNEMWATWSQAKRQERLDSVLSTARKRVRAELVRTMNHSD